MMPKLRISFLHSKNHSLSSLAFTTLLSPNHQCFEILLRPGRLHGRPFCGRWVETGRKLYGDSDRTENLDELTLSAGANWVQGLGQNPVWQRAQR